MGNACALWRGEIGASIVGILDTEARARLRAHLEHCEPCRAEYDNLVPVRDFLGRLAIAECAGAQPGGLALEPLSLLRLRSLAVREAPDEWGYDLN